MFCRWNITIYTRKISPIVFWMKSLRFRRLAFAVTSRLCLILEIFGSTDLHCCCLGSQFGGPVSLKSPALMLIFCLLWLRWRWINLFWQSMVKVLLLETNIPLTRNLSMDLVMQKFWLQVAQLEIQLHPCILQDMLHYNGLQATVILGIWDQRRDKYYMWILYQVRVSLSSHDGDYKV